MLTLALLLPSTLAHRLNIESALSAQGEILKERAMHLESSEYLAELFGMNEGDTKMDEMTSEKVWVYVLQSTQAITLDTLDAEDDVIAGVLLSPNQETAEAQVAALFASSPVFFEDELEHNRVESMLSPGGSMNGTWTNNSINGKSPSSSIRSPRISGHNPHFTARPLPSSTHQPDIVPRQTRATLLRNPSSSSANNPSYRLPVGKPREAITQERKQETFDGVPGHKRRESIAVKSTSKPKVEVRMTKAAALRLGVELPSPAKRPTPPVTAKENPKPTNGNGTKAPELHRRASSVALVPPSIAPRLNRSATLRTQPKAPPTSFMFRAPAPTTSQSRPQSRQQTQLRPSSVQSLRQTTSSYSRPPLSSAFPSTSSDASVKSDGSRDANGTKTPVAKVPPPASVAKAPSIAPRTNKSAALRAAKKEAEEREKAEKDKKQKAMRRRTLMV